MGRLGDYSGRNRGRYFSNSYLSNRYSHSSSGRGTVRGGSSRSTSRGSLRGSEHAWLRCDPTKGVTPLDFVNKDSPRAAAWKTVEARELSDSWGQSSVRGSPRSGVLPSVEDPVLVSQKAEREVGSFVLVCAGVLFIVLVILVLLWGLDSLPSNELSVPVVSVASPGVCGEYYMFEAGSADPTVELEQSLEYFHERTGLRPYLYVVAPGGSGSSVEIFESVANEFFFGAPVSAPCRFLVVCQGTEPWTGAGFNCIMDYVASGVFSQVGVSADDVILACVDSCSEVGSDLSAFWSAFFCELADFLVE